MRECRISFPKFNTEVFALPGTSLFECVTRAGILIRTPCAGAGKCGKCAVRVIKGELPPSKECERHFTPEKLKLGWRLACRAAVDGDLELDIPNTTLFESSVTVLSDTDETTGGGASGIKPMVQGRIVELTEPTLENPVSDLDNILRAIGLPRLNVGLDLARHLPNAVRARGFKVEVFHSDQELISIAPAPENGVASANLALAVDLGTTTIAISILDLHTGRQLAAGGVLNPQVSFGDDVLNRICAQSESDEKRGKMSSCVVAAINETLSELAKAGDFDISEIRSAVVAGNTVMQTLFCGIPAKWLGEIPFAPPFSHSMRLKATELGLDIHPNAPVALFPVISGFVGGDITAGLLATGFVGNGTDGASLFVDVGTNGEIVLRNGKRLLATAAAAGPAFEGAGIEFGMRAATGAIEKILIEGGTVRFNVIGDSAPRGICGTALIDIAAELLKNGLMDETGRILSPDECPTSVSQTLKKRLVPTSDGDTFDFLITPPGTEKIFLRQKDVRQLQLASGAIRAATAILLRKAELPPEKLDSILIAGGFGNYIRRSHAKRIGMIPDIPDSKIHFIGNTSLTGAKLALRDADSMRRAAEIAEKVECVDVSLDPEFQMEFGMSMIFPM